MAENVYECLFLLDSNHYARDPSGTAKLVDQLIADAGGTILVSRLWNEQRLAYPVKGHRKGTYWLTYFQIDPEQISQLNRACEIHDTVLRNLVLKVDPRLVDALVAHAKGESIAAPAEEATQTAPAAAEEAEVPSGEAPAEAEPAGSSE